MSDILRDPRVVNSLNRLKSLGLKSKTAVIDSDTVVIVVDIESVVNYIRKSIETRITYPNKLFIYDKESLLFGVILSKSNKKLQQINESEVSKALRLSLDLDKQNGGNQ